MNRAYIVWYETGEYDDKVDMVVALFASKKSADRFVRKYNDILESYNCHWGYSTSYDKADECAEKIQKELKLDYFCIEATTGGKFRVSLPMKIQP